MAQEEIPVGYCQCGCKGKTRIQTYSWKAGGLVAGKPQRFIKGHNGRGSAHFRWHGGRKQESHGYVTVLMRDHPRAMSGYLYEHVAVAEKALGKYLKDGVEVHHVNQRRADNRHENLVICENRSYHRLLHIRTKAYRASGHADYRKCQFCQQWDHPSQLAYHRSCRSVRLQRQDKTVGIE